MNKPRSNSIGQAGRRTPAMIALGFGLALLTSCTVNDATEQQAITDSPMVASNFVDPRAGANKWFPLIPGTQWVREGTTLIGNRTVPHKVVTTVTDVIRQIDGVPTVAVYDLSTGAGQVVQKSLDYFAQDKDGAVWTLGGTTEQYEAGRFVAIDEAWLSGIDGAKAGILMPADPPSATAAWSIAQPPEEDGDAAEFLKIQPEECVPFDCFVDVLVIREGKRSALDNEYKYYANGVGQIRNEPRGQSRHEDVERLINVTRLTPEGLTEASVEALRIDQQAATELPELFGDVKATRTP